MNLGNLNMQSSAISMVRVHPATRKALEQAVEKLERERAAAR